MSGRRMVAADRLVAVLISVAIGGVTAGGCGGRQTGGPTETTNEKTQPTSATAVPTGKR